MQWLSSSLAVSIALIAIVPIGAFAESDTDPPELVDFDFNPKSVDVTLGPADVTCTATLTDNGAVLPINHGQIALRCHETRTQRST